MLNKTLLIIFLLPLIGLGQNKWETFKWSEQIMTQDGKQFNEEKSHIFVVVSRANCSGCYHELLYLLKKSKLMSHVSILVDIPSLPLFEREIFKERISDLMETKKLDFYFLKAGRIKTITEELGICPYEKSPYFIAQFLQKFEAICYESIFDDNVVLDSVLSRMKNWKEEF